MRKMKIRNALKFLNEIKYMRSVFRRFGDSLVRGRYYQYGCFRALSLDESVTRSKADLYFVNKNMGRRKEKITKILNKIGFFNNRNRWSTEDYEAFYSANNYDKVREIKLFSFKREKVLTICTTRDEVDKQLLQYKDFGKSYSMPRIEKSDRYENSFEVSMINLKNFQDESLALGNIARSTAAYNSSMESVEFETAEKVLDFLYENEEINAYMKKITDRISPSVACMDIPYCMQHGDLSKENLLYGECEGKVDFWWIDWEHVADRPFFYDFFFYMVHSAFYGRREAYNCYISGRTDNILEELFSHFGLKYEKQHRFDYLMLYFAYFLNERVCFVSGLPTVIKYYELIETLEAEMHNEA